MTTYTSNNNNKWGLVAGGSKIEYEQDTRDYSGMVLTIGLLLVVVVGVVIFYLTH